ncbi:hypothetical protein HYH03_008007 [Edaphochlamys debaryana]|uniref:Uncharacterized protein n=1 Tax=Edaphochlamys debaryana TaxID=47281 RepID=A0A835XZB2_9CHLO|nr:hypothetical protein HYH03_008007 [Edaphochlamys debaryana]|eukprot:KAG2493787.1 hypothetical protein HYH03_008007 [Edaphochlamys debaryana]
MSLLLSPPSTPAPPLPPLPADFLNSTEVQAAQASYNAKHTLPADYNFSASFGNCSFTPPADCNGHGKLGDQNCYCICDEGYASDFSNLLAPRWCIPATQLSTGGNRTVDLNVTYNDNSGGGFWHWLGTPMGASITLVVCFVIFAASLCCCIYCYRKYRRSRQRGYALPPAPSLGAAHAHGQQSSAAYAAAFAQAMAAKGGAGALDYGGAAAASRHRAASGAGGGSGAFFKSWWQRKSALLRGAPPPASSSSSSRGGRGGSVALGSGAEASPGMAAHLAGPNGRSFINPLAMEPRGPDPRLQHLRSAAPGPGFGGPGSPRGPYPQPHEEQGQYDGMAHLSYHASDVYGSPKAAGSPYTNGGGDAQWGGRGPMPPPSRHHSRSGAHWQPQQGPWRDDQYEEQQHQQQQNGRYQYDQQYDYHHQHESRGPASPSHNHHNHHREPQQGEWRQQPRRSHSASVSRRHEGPPSGPYSPSGGGGGMYGMYGSGGGGASGPLAVPLPPPSPSPPQRSTSRSGRGGAQPPPPGLPPPGSPGGRLPPPPLAMGHGSDQGPSSGRGGYRGEGGGGSSSSHRR